MTTSRFGACLFAVLLLAGCASYDVATLDDIPEPVRRSVRAAVDGGHRTGVVIGLVNPVGRHFYSYGTLSVDDARPPTPETQFGAGSLTKLFTAELLADQVVRGEVRLDERFAGRLVFDERTPEGGQVRRSPMYARSDTELFLRDVPVTFVFPPGDGPAQRVILRVADSGIAMVRQDPTGADARRARPAAGDDSSANANADSDTEIRRP